MKMLNYYLNFSQRFANFIRITFDLLSWHIIKRYFHGIIDCTNAIFVRSVTKQYAGTKQVLDISIFLILQYIKFYFLTIKTSQRYN